MCASVFVSVCIRLHTCLCALCHVCSTRRWIPLYRKCVVATKAIQAAWRQQRALRAAAAAVLEEKQRTLALEYQRREVLQRQTAAVAAVAAVATATNGT